MGNNVVAIIFGVITCLSLIFCVVLVIDAAIFRYTIREVRIGMTGKEVQSALGRKIIILQVHKDGSYIAMATSYLTIFKCRLVFVNGRLMTKSKS